MKEEIKIPEGCEVDTITTENGSVVVTFKEKEPQLPETWVEFCETYPMTPYEFYINNNSVLSGDGYKRERDWKQDRNLLPDRETAEAVRALCQLIQLRDCYNRGKQTHQDYAKILLYKGEWIVDYFDIPSILVFNSNEDAHLFLENFRDLIEKLKPLYGIKEGGEE